jgi:hypothetical protein
VQCFGLYGKLEMIVVSTTSHFLILLTLYFCAALGWILGRFFRKKHQERCCWKEAPCSEEWLKRSSTEILARRWWIIAYASNVERVVLFWFCDLVAERILAGVHFLLFSLSGFSQDCTDLVTVALTNFMFGKTVRVTERVCIMVRRSVWFLISSLIQNCYG